MSRRKSRECLPRSHEVGNSSRLSQDVFVTPKTPTTKKEAKQKKKACSSTPRRVRKSSTGDSPKDDAFAVSKTTSAITKPSMTEQYNLKVRKTRYKLRSVTNSTCIETDTYTPEQYHDTLKRYQNVTSLESAGSSNIDSRLDALLNSYTQRLDETNNNYLVGDATTEARRGISLGRICKADEAALAKRNRAKYGVKIPTFDEIMKFRNDTAILRKQNEELAKLHAAPVTECRNTHNHEPSPKRTTQPDLNCRCITVSKLRKLFEHYEPHLRRVTAGKTEDERHARYQANPHSGYQLSDFQNSASITAFTHEQKSELITLLDNRFSGAGIPNYSLQYCFKVLLPEVCTRIFCDAHDMNESEAATYFHDKHNDSLP